MEQENQLEKDIKKFDWKEWTPFIGLYFVPRNIKKGEESQSLEGKEFINGCYLGLTTFLPIFYLVSKIIEK